MNDLNKHIKHYTPLLIVFLLGIFGFVLFAYERTIQTILAISLSLAYFSWGVVHHRIHKDLDLITLLEYFGVSLLGLVMILSLIFRS